MRCYKIFEEIPIEKVLKAFDDATKVEDDKQHISLYFGKKCQISAFPESFYNAKGIIEEKLKEGYKLRQASIKFKEFADFECCHINLLKERGKDSYEFEEDLEMDPSECIVTCSYDNVCKKFYKTIASSGKKVI